LLNGLRSMVVLTQSRPHLRGQDVLDAGRTATYEKR